jgi:DNA repair ATPase RecN
LDHFVKSINSLTQAEAAIDKLNQLAQSADAFNSIATSLERMATSFDTMSSKESKVRSLFDTLSKAKLEINTVTESTPAAMGGTTFDPSVTKMYNLLENWNINGVPIRANINGDTLKIAPNEVNNRTGIKTRTK